MKFDNNYSEIEDALNVPEFGEFTSFQDADDEIRPIAKFLKSKTIHNEYIEPDRIKFFFSNKPKKTGGRYSLGQLMVRSEIERCVDDTFDYIVVLFYPVYKKLSNEDKIIQVDKVLSGIDLGTLEKPAIKKRAADVSEYSGNLNFFGLEKVHNSSEAVHLACESFVEEQKGM